MSKTVKTKSDAIRYLVALGHQACDRIQQLEAENAALKAQISKMKCCENCKFGYYDGIDWECHADMHKVSGNCTMPDLELWQLRER